MNRRSAIAVGGAVGLLIVFFAWEWYLSPQARVERVLLRAADAAEERDLPRLLSCLSADYSDFRNFDYQRIAEAIEQGFAKIDRLNVTIQAMRTEVDHTNAACAFDLTVVAVRDQQRFLLVGTPMQPRKLRAELRREEEGWKIVRVVAD